MAVSKKAERNEAPNHPVMKHAGRLDGASTSPLATDSPKATIQCPGSVRGTEANGKCDTNKRGDVGKTVKLKL